MKCSAARQIDLHNLSVASGILPKRVTVYTSPFPNESTSQGTFRPETWTEQEALHHLPHSLARCSETSDSSSTASTTKTKTRNRKYNNMVLEAKSAILLVYLMTSIELTHFIITQRSLIKYNPVILLLVVIKDYESAFDAV